MARRAATGVIEIVASCSPYDWAMVETLNEDPHSHDAIAAARAYGIDLSLTDYLLSLSPLQRLERHDQALELIRAARTAGREHYGFDPRTAQTPD